MTIRRGGFSLRLRVRPVIVGAVLALLALTVSVFTLTSGDFPIPVPDVLRALVGAGDAATNVIVLELRLPRVAVALLVGIALGASGAVFQSLTRNPLGSPDFVGLTVGSSTGALLVILLLGGSGFGVSAGAIAGCVATSVLVYLLAFRRGVQPFRLVLMGIGVSALLDALNTFLILRARLADAIAAQVWLIGSVSGRTYTEVVIVGLGVVVVLPVLVYASRQLAMLNLGDEVAVVQGVRVEPARAVLAGGAVVLAAVATAAAGPVGFVALSAPHIAARLTRAPGANILPSAAMGAVLMVGGDWVAQRILPDRDLPVGVVTAAAGGAYLCWLLAREWRRGV
ncbi:FecCD family ABC transporter permease [Cryptosporangium phraense]|uniref:FecCD family ABC transporter permease n=1 Tax=Cryptosporangium phraense TaxID=2593070 RepID=UPI00197ADE68|nr:iron chelate uptake ABC transporter family permease subunit [Cryptosporangium phraense]